PPRHRVSPRRPRAGRSRAGRYSRHRHGRRIWRARIPFRGRHGGGRAPPGNGTPESRDRRAPHGRHRAGARAAVRRGRAMSRAATRGAPRIDRAAWLALPAVIFVLAVFILPFAYGLVLSFTPKQGGALANYVRFFSDPNFYRTVGITLWLALPATLINVLLSVPIAYRLRYPSRSQRFVTALLVVPITLGTV